MRALKLTGIVLGVLVALIALMLIGVRLFVNPNDFKGRIEKTVKDQTGRELHLPGDIKLSVFPWIALELGPVSLSNPTGFPAEPFIQVKHLALRVRLLPLLHKELNVGRIDIDGLDLRLLKNAQGKGNWEDFGGKDTGAGSGRLGVLDPGAARSVRCDHQGQPHQLPGHGRKRREPQYRPRRGGRYDAGVPGNPADERQGRGAR